MELENIILKNLVKNEDFSRKVLPYLKEEYFTREEFRILFSEIRDQTLKHNTLPNEETLSIEIERLKGRSEDQIKDSHNILKEIFEDTTTSNMDWLLERTEEFCQDRAIYNSITKSIEIINSNKSKLSKGIIPQLLSDALAITFDPNVGHDYFENAEDRYNYMHQVLNRIPFDLDFFNKITNGGLPNKTLSVILAGTNVGKSLFMCHCAATNLIQGKNVLYITLELSEEEVAKRIDANLLNIDLDDLKALPKQDYLKRTEKLKLKTNGKLIIKEYPTAGASVIHFESLLNELMIKKSFKPDIIYVDYINIMQSSRIGPSGASNMYLYVKAIAEELRGLGVKKIVPVVTATQVNRVGFNSSDIDLTNVSESFGLPATADFMFGLISTEELEKLGQYLVKQLKSRLGNANKNKRFVIGVDKSKMKLYDVEESAQRNITDSGQEPQKNDVKTNKFKGIVVNDDK